MNQYDFAFIREPDFYLQLGKTLFAVVVIWLIRRLVVRIISQSTNNTTLIYTWRKGSEYLSLAVGGLVVGAIWIGGFRSASTFIGLLSAGIAVSLQDLITNVMGWVYLMARRPLQVGDRIEIGGQAGDVIDIQWFHITLLEIRNWVDADQNTGRLLHIPNRSIFSQPVANFTSGIPHIWHEIPVMITFESDWRKAKHILFEIAGRHSLLPTAAEEEAIRHAARNVNIHVNYLTPMVYLKVASSGVVLTLRYLCSPRGRRSSEEQIWEEVLDSFAKYEEIDLAYETQRVFYQPVEGKGHGGVVSAAQRIPYPVDLPQDLAEFA